MWIVNRTGDHLPGTPTERRVTIDTVLLIGTVHLVTTVNLVNACAAFRTRFCFPLDHLGAQPVTFNTFVILLLHTQAIRTNVLLARPTLVLRRQESTTLFHGTRHDEFTTRIQFHRFRMCQVMSVAVRNLFPSQDKCIRLNGHFESHHLLL